MTTAAATSSGPQHLIQPRHVGRSARPHGELGGGTAGADRAHPDPLFPKLPIEPSGETHLRELRCGIDRLVARSAQTGNRSHDDDVTRSRLEEVGNHSPDRPHGSGNVRIHHVAQLLVGEIHDPPICADPGIGHQGVQATKPGDRRIDETPRPGRISHVHLDDRDPVTELVGQGVEAISSPGSDDDRTAVSRNRHRCGCRRSRRSPR